MELRAKIHSLWESFFPSSIYLVLFIVVGASYFDVIGVVKSYQLLPLTPAELRASRAYEFLKELELVKLAPLVAIFLLAFSVYIFDRVVSVVGNSVPPFPVWHGSVARYAQDYLTFEMLRLLPHCTNASSLDYEAELIIDGAKAKGMVMPTNSLEYRAQNFSAAARIATYGKAGIVWLLVLFVLAMACGRPFVSSLAITILYSMIFIALICIGFVRETTAIIATTEAKLRLAVDLLRIQEGTNRNQTDHERLAKLQSDLAKTREQQPRLLFWDWKFRFDHHAVIAATTGVRLRKKKGG